MGKKRLTLFSLRPRHTAIVVTIITGMLISSMALIVLVTANVQFKRLLTEGEQIFESNKRLASANKRLGKLNVSLEAEARERQKEVMAARTQARRATRDRDKAVAVVARLQGEIALRQKRLDALQARADAAERISSRKPRNLRACGRSWSSPKASWTRRGKDWRRPRRNSANAEAASKRVAQIVMDQQQAIVDLGNEKLQYQRQTSDLRSRQLILRQGDEIVRGVVAHKARLGTRLELLNLLKGLGQGRRPRGRKGRERPRGERGLQAGGRLGRRGTLLGG